ncbi:hypothetical protein H5410_005681 [Solanum commersonii]|uniref:Reverse transcriptase zinc-binding domain-containing protein n=1 Tax=Solanum commersonii TaxID=4109 RepID=A0A9J6A903_SOLCO|nr:hypothetical protein H5410_005681 [Solanum commersonii]
MLCPPPSRICAQLLVSYCDTWQAGRVWKQRPSMREILIKICMVDEVHSCCCNANVQEIVEHLFISCPTTQLLWVSYANDLFLLLLFGRFEKEEIALLMEVYKYNSDRSTKGNPGPSSSAFCIRDCEGE